MTPPSWLEARAARDPRGAALEWQGSPTDFVTLRDRARRRCAGLRAAGVARGDVVAALLPGGPGFVELLHAVDALGATLLPLHLRLPPSELSFQLADAGPRLLVHGAGDLALRARRSAAAAGGLVNVPTAPLETIDGEPDPPPGPVDPEAPLALLYTSGTTGRPKGALLSRRAFAASAAAAAERLASPPGERWLACLPLYHVGGLSLLTRSVISGGAVVVHAGFDAAVVSERLDRGDVAGVSLVPAMLARLLDARADRPAPPGLRTVLLGGAAAPEALIQRAQRAGFPIAPTYGLTEATSQVATRRPAETGNGLTPLPGCDVRIVAPDGSLLPSGTPGEIQVRGRTVMSGYHGRPEETARALRDGWRCTGDVGRIDRRGRLHVLDRRADLIVSGGENVYPAEIERGLLSHPAVREAGVAAVADASFGQRPKAWLVVSAAAPDDAALAAFCRERLAGYKVPVAFERVSALPRNALGKLLRHRLGSPATPDSGSLTERDGGHAVSG